jgi:hypothetical protein
MGLVRVPANGGDPAVVIPSPTDAGVAVDASCVYWADPGRGVFSITRP